MHGMLVVLGFLVPWLVRRWETGTERALWLLTFPTLWLTCTAIAIVGMGSHGHLLGIHCAAGWPGRLAPWWAWGWLLWVGLSGMAILLRAGQSHGLWQQQTTPTTLQGQAVWLWEQPLPWAAQVGWWRSRIVVSRGMVERLTPEHLAAVLAHEVGHGRFHDPLWFLLWEWLRCCTQWFPRTEALWQEVLFQREVRADRFAQAQTSGLLLAEALVQVQQHIHAMGAANKAVTSHHGGCPVLGDRLVERIQALVQPPPKESPQGLRWWLQILEPTLAVLPLVWIPLHFF
jgi:hypothetical protein